MYKKYVNINCQVKLRLADIYMLLRPKNGSAMLRIPVLGTYFPQILHGNSSPSNDVGGDAHALDTDDTVCPTEPWVRTIRSS